MPSKCLYCDKSPLYALPGNKAICCSQHKDKTMIDVVHKRCVVDSCNKHATHNIKGLRPEYCAGHKMDTMIDTLNKRCSHESCNKTPMYGNPGSKPEFCVIHKEKFMIDVKSKKCLVDDCESRAMHGLPGKSREYCTEHRTVEMINYVVKSCIFKNCQKQASCGLKMRHPMYCAEHKTDKMQDVINKRCTSCGVFRVIKRTNFLCSYCCQSPKQKTKEKVVKDLLENNEYNFVHNKQIGNSACVKYRPDFLFDCTTYFVVLECDENAHKHYDQECEISRMNNISYGLGLPTLFIRYNPDCKGISKKLKHKKLIETLESCLHKEFISTIEPIYLFY